jgi:cytoskeleton protein RodZ
MDETAAPDSAPVARTIGPALETRSIGQRLRAGRERAGLSVAASAEKLHLDPKVIEALEADRFAELGASVYVRGHLRRYADFVGEAGAELVASYLDKSASRPPPPDLTQVPHPERRSDPRRLKTPLLGLSAAAVLALAIWWVLAGSRPGAEKPGGVGQSGDASTAPPVAAPVAAPAPVGPSASGTPAATSAVAAPVVAPATADPAQVRKEEAVPARSMRLSLELANDSWVEVYDSRGERLFYDVASAGSVQSVEGRPPLRVVLGNSLGVAVEVDGQRREIPSNAADGEGARFVVNRSGSLSRSR